jgi:probable phosphoglycerate mutase
VTLLVMVRHGPTAWTAERRIQGRTDVPLSPDGRAMVMRWRLPAFIPDGQAGMVPLDHAVWLTSPLARALETAELLAASAQAAPRIDDRLVEMCYGAWEGRMRADIDAEIGAGMPGWRGLGLDFAPPGGESPRQVQDRLMPLLREIAAAKRATMAVCHKGIIRAVYSHAVAWDMVSKPPHRLQDGAAHVFSVSPDGAPSLVAANISLLPASGSP